MAQDRLQQSLQRSSDKAHEPGLSPNAAPEPRRGSSETSPVSFSHSSFPAAGPKVTARHGLEHPRPTLEEGRDCRTCWCTQGPDRVLLSPAKWVACLCKISEISVRMNRWDPLCFLVLHPDITSNIRTICKRDSVPFHGSSESSSISVGHCVLVLFITEGITSDSESRP